MVQDAWQAEPANEPQPLAGIAMLLFLAGVIAAIVTTARRSMLEPSTGRLPDFMKPSLDVNGDEDHSRDSSSPSPSSRPSSPSSSAPSTFRGGGGSGGGGGASDRW
jgi:uncharacterized membrane protein YgcG